MFFFYSFFDLCFDQLSLMWVLYIYIYIVFIGGGDKDRMSV